MSLKCLVSLIWPMAMAGKAKKTRILNGMSPSSRKLWPSSSFVPCGSERQPHRRNEGLSEEGTFYIGSYLGRRIHFLKLSATAVNPKSPIIAAAGVKE